MRCSGRGGASGGRGRGRGGRRPHLQSNSYRYDEGEEAEGQPGAIHEGGAAVSSPAGAAHPQPQTSRSRAHEDDLSSLLKDGFDPTQMNLLVLPDGSYLEDETLKQSGSISEGEDDDQYYEEDSEYEEEEEFEDDGDEHVTPAEAGLATEIKVDSEFKADEVDELDAFLAETSISSESRKYFKNPTGAAPRSATPQKNNDATQKWLDSVII